MQLRLPQMESNMSLICFLDFDIILHIFNDLKKIIHHVFMVSDYIEMSSSDEPRGLSGLLPWVTPILGPCPNLTGEKAGTCLGLDVNPQPANHRAAWHARTSVPLVNILLTPISTPGKSIIELCSPMGFLTQQVWVGHWESESQTSSWRTKFWASRVLHYHECLNFSDWLIAVIYREKCVRRWDHQFKSWPCLLPTQWSLCEMGWQYLSYTFLWDESV